jgi:hypothetical protein
MKHAALATLGLLLLVTPATAQELFPIEPDIAQLYATLLNEEFKKAEGVQVSIDADIEKAKGLALGMEGILIVPTKGLDAETAITNPAAQDEKGAPLAVIFMSPRFNPLIDGQPPEEGQLRTLTFMDGEGNEQKATALVLTARNVEAEDWRLYVYGTGEKPVIDSQFGGAEEIPDEEETVNISVKDVKDNKATLVVRVFGLYTASFEISHNVEDLF